jgi:hypothetical protein
MMLESYGVIYRGVYLCSSQHTASHAHAPSEHTCPKVTAMMIESKGFGVIP